MNTIAAVRCYCGQVHTTHVGVTTRCSCGLLLWPQVWEPAR